MTTQVNTQRPLLSVLIPFHASAGSDRRHMLIELINSIPDSPEIEIIVVDDHSPLAPNGLPERQGRLLVAMNALGQHYAGSARNHALRLCRGHYAIFADSDDVFDGRGLLSAVNTLDPDIKDFCVLAVEAREFSIDVDPSAPVLYAKTLNAGENTDIAKALADWQSPWGKIFPVDLALERRVLCTENQQVANDVVFSTRLALATESLKIHSGPVYYVRRNHGKGALTARKDPSSIRTRIETVRRMNSLLEEHGRGDIVVPMHHAFSKHMRAAPGVVLEEILHSIKRGDTILPSFGKMLRRLKTS